ncbi:hypothetical protein KR018_005570, partial [Drosophila ironensis]
DELANVPTPGGIVERLTASSLEYCLNEIVRCSVCETVPNSVVFQCGKGHLICAGCYEVIMYKQNGRITCAACGETEFSASRNIVAEMAVAEVELACERCGAKMLRSGLRHHFLNDCPKRLVGCRNRRLGCTWAGEPEGLLDHEDNCPIYGRSLEELVAGAQVRRAKRDARQQLINKILVVMQMPTCYGSIVHVPPQKNHVGPYPLGTFEKVATFTVCLYNWELWLKLEECPASEADLGDDPNGAMWLQLRLRPDTVLGSPFVFGCTFVQGKYSEVRFLPNICERCQINPNLNAGPPILFYRHKMIHCRRLLNDCGLITRVFMVTH